jgi:2-C-methyl-D-erythritol 4-phosphate cytidylyltransferase
LTTPQDLAIAEFILKTRLEQEWRL